MTDNADLEQTSPPGETPTGADGQLWARVKDHKIIQWGLAYLGAALALAHGQHLLAEEFHWPDVLGRVFMIVLIAGLPIALTLAWYHGHRGLNRISTGEFTIISLLLVIAAFFFRVGLQPEHAAEAASVPLNSPPADMVRPAATPAGRATRATTLPTSLAVLPFESQSLRAEDADLASGIHEQVIIRLQKIQALTVMSRPSVLRYAGGEATIPEIARQLNVEAVITSTIRFADGNVRITPHLIDAATQAELWSEVYTRPFENIFALETDIATEIAKALEAELAPGEQRNLAKPPTQSAEAYDHFLRALAAFRLAAGGLGVSPDETAEFHRHIDRALELDRDFALAYAVKARDYAYSMGRRLPRSTGLSFEDRAELAMKNAERALALDPDNGLAYAAIATVHRLKGEVVDARVAIDRALALSPNDYQVLFDASVLNFLRNPDAGLAYAQRAARINPEEGFLALGLAYVSSGDYAAAAAQFEPRLDSPANYPTMPFEYARVELLRGNKESALRNLGEQERRGIRPPATIPNVAYTYYLLGAHDDARRVAGKFEEFAEDYATGPGDWALTALASGNHTEALEWLRRSVARPSSGPDIVSIGIIATNFFEDPVLDQPEFVELRNTLLERLGRGSLVTSPR